MQGGSTKTKGTQQYKMKNIHKYRRKSKRQKKTIISMNVQGVTRGEVSKMPTLRKNCIYSMAFNT